MPRTLSGSLAAVVEDLELEQPAVVTMAELRKIVARHHVLTSPAVVASRLRANGWLLPTGSRGVWEFAPGAHAGPYGRGEPTMVLRAALAATPNLDAALALGSAAWALGYADRAPAKLDVAVPHPSAAPAALTRAAHMHGFTCRVGYLFAKGVPVHRPESVLAHLAASPSSVRFWSSVLEWLPDLAADLDVDVVAAELANRPVATRVRAGYLISGMRPDVADLVRTDVGDVVRFGARGAEQVRHDGTWRVLDSLLPVDPTRLDPVT